MQDQLASPQKDPRVAVWGYSGLCAEVETRHEKADLPGQTSCITMWKTGLKHHKCYFYLFTYLF